MAKYLKWNIIAPVALLAAALVTVAWFDIRTGGDAKPAPFIGDAEGTPVRYAYTQPTSTPPGAKPTPTAAPASQPPAVPEKTVQGTADERDARRRADLLLLLDATKKLRDKEGRFPDTNDNVQSACIYTDRDALCKLDQFLGGPSPTDPLGSQNGYWYSGAPDGQSMKIFASLEGTAAADAKCLSKDEGINKRPNVICVTVP